MDLDVRGSKETDILSLCTDSKVASPGSLFIAKKGGSHNGVDFLEDAVQAGATALITPLYNPFLKVPQIVCPHPEQIEAELALRFYERPSDELFVVGVTGTKGKSTTTYLIQHLLSHCGLIGTVETITGGERRASSFTTPFPIELQKLLREMRNKKDAAVSMEVSSHGVAQNRIEGIEFDAAVFTNLAPDHLDYHTTLEEYALAKKGLFQRLDQSKKSHKRAIFNGDHPWTPFMREGIQTPVWTFGFGPQNDVRATDLAFDAKGSTFTLCFEGKKTKIRTPLLGKFNVSNALAAIGVALHRGEPIEKIATFHQVPGRLERVANDRGIWAFVDFAHTGESMENVLQTMREFVTGKIILVFGAGGDRDPRRRFDMGKVANQLADRVFITSDNPRTEDPMTICQEIHSMFCSQKEVEIIVDRRDAIQKAVNVAKSGDVVLVVGKGHEKVQIFGRMTIPFDDVEVLREALYRNNT